MIKRPDTKAQRIKRHKRVRAKVSGTPERPRLNVFRSEKNIYAQIIDDVAGNTLVAASSLDKAIEGITIEVPAQNKIVIHGCDKQKVGQFAAEVREKRPPEPYKGKGIKYADEVIRRKVGKTGAKK